MTERDSKKRTGKSTVIFGEIFNTPVYGRLTIEIAKGNRLCRGHSQGRNCNRTIFKNSKCLTEKYLTKIILPRSIERTVYKKLSYCPDCALKRVNLIYDEYQKELRDIEYIKKYVNLIKEGKTIKSGRYARA